MAGHSKWANIKHRKEGADKKRGIAFTRISKEIMVAARLGGSDPASNARLRIAVSKARAVNMPRDTIERAIKKGAGELEGQTFEEITYEIYAPGGVGIIVEALTDKKSRTTPEIKSMVTKYLGNLAEVNAVTRLFQRRGYLAIEAAQIKEDDLMEIVLGAGAEDLRTEHGIFEVITPPELYAAVSETVAEKSLQTIESGVSFLPLPGTEVEVNDPEMAAKNDKLIDALESHDDVQAVYHNMVVPTTA